MTLGVERQVSKDRNGDGSMQEADGLANGGSVGSVFVFILFEQDIDTEVRFVASDSGLSTNFLIIP